MRKKAVAAGGLLLVGAGYLAGLLTAPKSGKETRKDIANTANKARIEVEKKLKVAHTELQELLKIADGKSKVLKDKAKKELADKISVAKKAQAKAKEILSAIHHGDADDPNLQAALDEVRLAKRNLAEFLKKH